MKFENMLIGRSDQAAWQEVEENVVVVNSNTRKVHILSGIGGRIWQILEHPRQQTDIVNVIMQEYDVAREQAENDVDSFLQELAQKEIIKIKDE
ncbi:MAG: PqqD family protein [PVC group bacterium]|nr:PqqD family protein [PVC group bacterium]